MPAPSLSGVVLGALGQEFGLQQGETLTPQSTLPDAAQQVGTGTGGTAVSGPSGLGAAQDVLGTLPPQGPGALSPD